MLNDFDDSICSGCQAIHIQTGNMYFHVLNFKGSFYVFKGCRVFCSTLPGKIHYLSGKHRPPLRFDLRKTRFSWFGVYCPRQAVNFRPIRIDGTFCALTWTELTAENKVLTLTCSGANSFGVAQITPELYWSLPFNVDKFGNSQTL